MKFQTKKLKMLAALGLAVTLSLGCSGNVMAASPSVTWKVDYAPGAPSDSANPVHEFCLYACQKIPDEMKTGFTGLEGNWERAGQRFTAVCQTLSGSCDRMIRITCLNAGGIDSNDGNFILFTDVGKRHFQTRKASLCTKFRVNALGATLCSSTGKIIKRME